jgi:acyl carrier protein
MDEEEELVLDPAFFLALQDRLPQISEVQVGLKRGRHRNELTRFRYDVTLRVGLVTRSNEHRLWLDWKSNQMSLPKLREFLHRRRSQSLGITGVPDVRLSKEARWVELLAGLNGPETVSELRNLLPTTRGEGVDPEDVWALEQELPYSVHLQCSAAANDACFNILIDHRSREDAVQNSACPAVGAVATGSGNNRNSQSNDPLQAMARRRLMLRLRTFVESKLPSYMVPATFVILDSMPLTPNGKLDRRALPIPDTSRPIMHVSYIEPRTQTEEMLAGILMQLLGVERVGADDNFFELGGHSLLAVRVTSRIRDTFQVELPLRTVFDTPTLAGIAKMIDLARVRSDKMPVPAIRRLSRDEHRVTLLPGGALDPASFSKALRTRKDPATTARPQVPTANTGS